jgi:hypothetical protein
MFYQGNLIVARGTRTETRTEQIAQVYMTEAIIAMKVPLSQLLITIEPTHQKAKLPKKFLPENAVFTDQKSRTMT